MVDLLIRTISTFILYKDGLKLKVICVQTLVFHCTISNVSKVLRKYTQRGMSTRYTQLVNLGFVLINGALMSVIVGEGF